MPVIRWAPGPARQGRSRVAAIVFWTGAGLTLLGSRELRPVLDSTTGAGKEDQLGIAPYFSDGYVGILLTDSDHTVTAYRAEN